ncbi:hypothetical protein [Gemmatimonas sp.]|jgi:hypothetical protein|uniref:hypothetical protein n=1 Tax=Gemmatimonas sp. TaxID=1962908 RepID=UPI00391D4145
MSEATMGSGKKGSVWEDVLEVLWAPSTVFERSAGAGVGLYMLVLTAILAIIVFATKGLLQPYIDANYDLQMIQLAKRGGKPIPAEAVAAGRTVAGYVFLGFSVLTPVIGGFFGGLTTWGGAKILGVPLTVGRATFIATLSTVPRIVAVLATAVQGAVLDSAGATSFFSASLGPARFLDATTASPAVLALLGSLDLFAVWGVVITAVGISVVARVSRGTGWAASVVAWGIAMALTLIPTAFS